MLSIDPSKLDGDAQLHRVWDQMGRPAGCRVVGGYVRDRLLGRPSNDLDLVLDGDDESTARPADRLAEALGVRAHLLGTPPHRIWRIETEESKIEIWPLGELSSDEDLRRRDYTCNALGWGLPDGPLLDLVGGLDDLARHTLRAVSRRNLADDPIRLIRGPRFLAQLPDFDLDGETRSWIRALAPTLAGAPRERIGHELLELLRAPAPSRALAECLDLGLAEPAAPAACELDPGWLSDHLEAVGRVSGGSDAGGTPAPQQNETARLALLFRAWGLPSSKRLAAYAWPQQVREDALRAARMLSDAIESVASPAADRRELAWRAGTAFPALVALGAAVAPHPGWSRWRRQWRRDPEALLDPRPLLTGLEIAEITGVGPGPELGETLQALVRAQVRREVRSRRGAVRWLEAARRDS